MSETLPGGSPEAAPGVAPNPTAPPVPGATAQDWDAAIYENMVYDHPGLVLDREVAHKQAIEDNMYFDHPNLVGDVEKAHTMAIAGNEFRTKAANNRDLLKRVQKEDKRFGIEAGSVVKAQQEADKLSTPISYGVLSWARRGAKAKKANARNKEAQDARTAANKAYRDQMFAENAAAHEPAADGLIPAYRYQVKETVKVLNPATGRAERHTREHNITTHTFENGGLEAAIYDIDPKADLSKPEVRAWAYDMLANELEREAGHRHDARGRSRRAPRARRKP